MKVVLDAGQPRLARVEVVQQNLRLLHPRRQVALLSVGAHAFLELVEAEDSRWNDLLGPLQLVLASGQNSLNFSSLPQHIGSGQQP